MTDSLVNQSGRRRHDCPQGKHRQDPPRRQPEASPSPAPGTVAVPSGHAASPYQARREALAHTYWGLKLQAFFLKVRVYLMGKNHREIKIPADFSRARSHSWETPRPAGVTQQLRTRPFPLFMKPACHNDTRHRSTPRHRCRTRHRCTTRTDNLPPPTAGTRARTAEHELASRTAVRSPRHRQTSLLTVLRNKTSAASGGTRASERGEPRRSRPSQGTA